LGRPTEGGARTRRAQSGPASDLVGQGGLCGSTYACLDPESPPLWPLGSAPDKARPRRIVAGMTLPFSHEGLRAPRHLDPRSATIHRAPQSSLKNRRERASGKAHGAQRPKHIKSIRCPMSSDYVPARSYPLLMARSVRNDIVRGLGEGPSGVARSPSRNTGRPRTR
jgi:hypothetical protein